MKEEIMCIKEHVFKSCALSLYFWCPLLVCSGQLASAIWRLQCTKRLGLEAGLWAFRTCYRHDLLYPRQEDQCWAFSQLAGTVNRDFTSQQLPLSHTSSRVQGGAHTQTHIPLQTSFYLMRNPTHTRTPLSHQGYSSPGEPLMNPQPLS